MGDTQGNMTSRERVLRALQQKYLYPSNAAINLLMRVVEGEGESAHERLRNAAVADDDFWLPAERNGLPKSLPSTIFVPALCWSDTLFEELETKLPGPLYMRCEQAYVTATALLPVKTYQTVANGRHAIRKRLSRFLDIGGGGGGLCSPLIFENACRILYHLNLCARYVNLHNDVLQSLYPHLLRIGIKDRDIHLAALIDVIWVTVESFHCSLQAVYSAIDNAVPDASA
ncbi:hypothetical protein KP509_23G054800 [Ceratopteris richardii]|uniref:Uncharacterized protein n=1 Tax=Ceratopteris richardii TaxID=49495 RepID=A0A8T2S0K6_CERRI|nr:hypothetical protein KP509_23G054800 [Ceratopteris richardii]